MCAIRRTCTNDYTAKVHSNQEHLFPEQRFYWPQRPDRRSGKPIDITENCPSSCSPHWFGKLRVCVHFPAEVVCIIIRL